MKHFGTFILATLLSMPLLAQDRGHGGGNGGDDLELELKKRSLQIGHFLNSTVGKANFKMINPEAVIETINRSDIDVVAGDVTDKYGTLRTCVNEEARALITCNLKRISALISGKKTDILTAVLFHEILGLMGIELGYQENVSLYPISSKIIPFTSLVESTLITEASIRPEFYGLDNRSYGVTLENKATKETLRLICLNDNIEVHRCRNFNIVRKLDKIQSPLVQEIAVISWEEIKIIDLSNISKDKYRNPLRKLLNQNQELALIGKTERVSEDVFNRIIPFLKKSFLTPAQKEANRIAAEKRAEQDRIAAEKKDAEEKAKREKEEAERPAKEAEARRVVQQARKDNEHINQIGGFSIKLKKDIVILANSAEIETYYNTSYYVPSINNYKVLKCSIKSFSQETYDRALVEGTVLKYQVGEAMKPTKIENENGYYKTLSAIVKKDNLSIQLTCVSDYSGVDFKVINFKDAFKNFFEVILDDPKQI